MFQEAFPRFSSFLTQIELGTFNMYSHHVLCLLLTKDLYLTCSTLKFWRRKWQPTPVLLLGKSHGRRSLVGCSPWGAKSQTQLMDFTSLPSLASYFITGEGNGSPLQYSCLENPMDGRAWWAMVRGVSESRTRRK